MPLNPDSFMDSLEPWQREIILTLRNLVRRHADDGVCMVKWGGLCYFKGRRPYVGLMPFRGHVAVIFDRGAELSDPFGLLEGKGKIRRQISIPVGEAIPDKELATFIAQSFELE